MKYLKGFSLFEVRSKIEMPLREIADLCGVKDLSELTINEDGTIDFARSVWVKKKMKTLPFKFGTIYSDFDLVDNGLTTLAGLPKEVGGNFTMHGQRIKNLKGMPKVIGGDIGIWCNTLETLEGCPDFSEAEFNCEDNNLTSLVGGPKKVKGSYRCGGNPLESLEGAPEKIISSGGNRFETVFEYLEFPYDDEREESDNDFTFRIAGPGDSNFKWGPEGWIKFMGSRKSEKAKKLVATLLKPDVLDNYFKKNPTDIYLLDSLPELKQEVLKRTGIRDMSRIGRNLKTGLI